MAAWRTCRTAGTDSRPSSSSPISSAPRARDRSNASRAPPTSGGRPRSGMPSSRTARVPGHSPCSAVHSSSSTPSPDVRRVAFLTLHDPTGFVIDDELAVLPLARRGIRVETLPWDRAGVDWRQHALVVVRSTWDYQHDAEAFLRVLETIERLGVRLENGSEIARWNMRKTYLRDLASRGIETVPTFWRDGLRRGELVPLFEELRSGEAVIKPVMGANAQGAWRLDAGRARHLAPEIEAYFAGRPLMMQPFERGIVEEGEFSMIYLNGTHSHSILKTPKRGDFRVQEGHGSEIVPIVPAPALLAAGDAAIAAVRQKLLYARADFVRSGDTFRVMELELVEPSLYLRIDPAAPERFADAIATLLA